MQALRWAFAAIPCISGYLAISRRLQRSVVAVVSVPAANRLLIVQYKFIEWYKESVFPDSCRSHDGDSQKKLDFRTLKM